VNVLPIPNRLRVGAACLVLAGAVLLASAPPGRGAGASVVVSLDVASASTLNTTGCVVGSASLAFGTVQPGTGAVTAACNLRFGSTNNTASLRIAQIDGRGAAMYRPFDDDLDTGFAAAGTYLLDNSVANDRFWDATEMPDGDIVLSGTTEPGGDEQTMLVRLQPNGAVRGTFGAAGVATLNSVPAGGEVGWSVIGRPDGTILLGMSRPAGAYAVARWTALGARDTTWADGDGWADLPDSQLPRNVETDATGRIYVAGTDFWPVVDCAVTRFLPTGLLDTSYGVGGTRHVFPAGSNCDGMDVEAAGRVVVAGGTGNDGLVVRLDDDGNVDAGFMGGSWQGDVDAGAVTAYNDVDAAPDGTWTIGGRVDGVGLVSRYDAAGAPIMAFDGNGHRRLSAALGSSGVRDVAWVDGRIVVAGSYGASEVYRLLPSGANDPSFSDDGFLDPATPADMEDNGMLLLGDGRLLMHGRSNPTGTAQATMLDADNLPDHVNTSSDWNDGTGFFGACLASVSGAGGATWTTGACGQSDGAWWNDVPAVAETVATAPSGDDTIIAAMRFGTRVPTTQPKGAYVAPVLFEVVAPAI
jgi:uncharacterized delta-60 repeat protein